MVSAGGLRRVHGIAQVRDTHTGYDRRIPEHDRRVREVVEQPHSCAEQHGSQIDVDLVEQPGVQALLDRLGAVHSHGLRAGSRSRSEQRRFRCRR